MKNNKGFTLVELLAVIAILAILVIIALPNVMGMFNDAKKNSFITEIKQIHKVAQQQWMMDSMMSTSDQVYMRCKTCTGKNLQLSGRTELDYYIKINKGGDFIEFFVTDGTYQYIYMDSRPLNITDITEVQEVAKLTPSQTLVISNNTCSSADGSSSMGEQEEAEFYTDYFPTMPFSYEVGMTWNDWINSDYNDNSFKIEDGMVILQHVCPTRSLNGVNPTDRINSTTYSTTAYGDPIC